MLCQPGIASFVGVHNVNWKVGLGKRSAESMKNVLDHEFYDADVR